MLATAAGNGLFLFAFALVYAMIEIEVEGPAGWAKNLPTPQKVLGHLSLYHVFMVAMAALVIGGLLSYRECATQKEWTWKRGLGLAGEYLFLLVVFFLAQDFLWFVLNPSYTIARYRQACIGWHRPWVIGVPAFNFAGAALLAVVLALHSRARGRLGATLGSCAAAVALTIAASPLYHRFYRKVHAPCFVGPSRNPELCGADILPNAVNC